MTPEQVKEVLLALWTIKFSLATIASVTLVKKIYFQIPAMKITLQFVALRRSPQIGIMPLIGEQGAN